MFFRNHIQQLLYNELLMGAFFSSAKNIPGHKQMKKNIDKKSEKKKRKKVSHDWVRKVC